MKTESQIIDDLGVWLCENMEIDLIKSQDRTFTDDAAKMNVIKDVARRIRFYRDTIIKHRAQENRQ